MRATRLCFFLFCLIGSPTGFAQLHDPFVQQRFQFDRLDHVKDIEDLTVTSFVQDDLGFIWFGTFEGLFRYDGYEVRHFRNDRNDVNSLASNSVRALAKDGNGNLWIATQGGGLDKLEIATEKFSHYQHNPADTTTISDNSIWSVMVDSRGIVWAGTYSKGLSRLDPSTNTFKRIREDEYFPVRCVMEDVAGMIWFSSNGLNRINPNDLSVTAYRPGKNDPPALTTGNIRFLLQDKKGRIWLAVHDEEGLFEFDLFKQAYRKVRLFDDPASAYGICEDRSGRLWVGTNKGIVVLDDGRKSYYQPDACDPASLRKKVILVIFPDREGSLWIGAEGGGVNKVLTRKPFQLFRYADTKNLLTHNSIRSLGEGHDGRIWIGWVEGGIDIYDPRANELYPFDTHGVDNITSICHDVDSSIWVGTWGHGLLHYNKKEQLIKSWKLDPAGLSIPDNRVQATLRDHQGALWVATENGVSVLDEKTNQWIPFKKPYFPNELLGSNVQSLAFIEGKDGSIWAGTWLGLNRISRDRQSVLHYHSKTSSNPLSGDHVISLCFDKNDSALWIGMFEGGLNRMDLISGEVTHFSDDDGLPDNTVFGIEQDTDGDLWLSTIKGLARFTPSTRKFRNFDRSDGLQGNEFFWGVAMKTRDEKMLFGGVNGLNLFTPSEIADKTSIPTVVITEFEIFNQVVQPNEANSPLQKSIAATREITLSHEQSVFTFDFSALDYEHPEKNLYAFKLEGFDPAWNYIGNKRSATYTNLDPGTYTFRVKGTNADGYWNEEGAFVKIVITPPVWLTWWFKTIAGALIVGSLLAFYYTRIGIANRQRTALEQQVKDRTREIVSKNEEIMAQMEKVTSLSEEIAMQRDNIEKQHNQLARSKLELEQKVRERTNELSQSNQELMKQNVQLEQFAFMTAHNLRAPVARLLGLTSIFNRQTLEDPINLEVIKRIQSSASGLDEVIRDIADILQVQKGIHTKFELIRVYPAVQRALKALSNEIKAARFTIMLNVDENLVIKGIPAYVHSVFYNLVSNAVKYADLRKENPHIRIESTQKNGEVTLSFSDNGIGFDIESQRGKLFKPFSRLNAFGEGKGLGLYLVKIEMEAMNGSVNISSEVDMGTTVTLVFFADDGDHH